MSSHRKDRKQQRQKTYVIYYSSLTCFNRSCKWFIMRKLCQLCLLVFHPQRSTCSEQTRSSLWLSWNNKLAFEKTVRSHSAATEFWTWSLCWGRNDGILFKPQSSAATTCLTYFCSAQILPLVFKCVNCIMSQPDGYYIEAIKVPGTGLSFKNHGKRKLNSGSYLTQFS